MANTINIKKYAKPKETTNVSQSGYANSVTRIINQTATGGVAAAFEPHYLWGQYFDDTRDISGDMTDVGNINATGNISTTANITAGGTITGNSVVANTADIGTLDADAITADDATITSILSNYIHNTGDIVNDNMITTKDLTVTGTAHFFELIIDKIKASGGAAIFTPADGFRIEDDTCIIPVQDGYVITFYTTDGQRAIRNMWQVGDQAICRSFNEAHVGTSYNVKNKYYWTLVTQAGTLAAGDTITDVNGDVIEFEEDRHFIRISTQSGVDADGRAYYDGTVDPEVGDEIAMLGYRGTDDPNRQSAIYISAYSSMDADIRAPFIAHYKGINDFQLSSHRKTWFAANSSQITGALKIQTNDGDVDVQTAIENGRQYIHTAYCRTEDNSDNSFSRTYFADAVYMGTAYTSTPDETSLTFADYAPWVRIRGVDGRNGTDGAGITTVEEWYYANSSTRQPTFNQSTWTQGTIPSNYNTTNRYLWNVEIIVYSTGDREDPTTPQMIGVYGTDGRGIQSITEYYKKSPNISGVTNTDSGWQITVPTVDETNRYLWNYELIRFTDNTPQRTPAALIGMYAEDGRSVEQITEWYYVTTSDTPKPTFSTSTWTRNSIPAMDETNAYLWNVEEIRYNDTTEYTGVALIGHFGADGRGIQSVTEYYAVHTSMDTAPTSGWQKSVPTMNATNKYLWNYECITYTDGDTQYTAPALIGVYSVGEDGKYTQFVFKYSDEQPATPTGQTIPPSGWSTTVVSSGSSSSSSGTTLTPLSVTSEAPSGAAYKFIYDSSTQTWHSPSTDDNGKRIDTFRFTLSRATTVTVRLRASSERNYDFGAAGKLDDTTLGSLSATTVKAQATGGENVMRAVSGTDTVDITYNCSAGSHSIPIGYFKDVSTEANDDCVYVQFFVADSSASTPVDTTQQLWMSFAVVDKGIVSPWSTPIPMGGRDGRDGTDGRDGVDGTNGRDAIAYYLSQSSGTFTYSGSAFSPSSVTLYLVRSDRQAPIIDDITVKSGCTVTTSASSTSIALTVRPTSTTQGGYFEITCLNDDGSEWGTLRYSYNLITKSFVSEIVDDQMTNYATKTELNSLGQTVNSYNSTWQQTSEQISSRVQTIENSYATTTDLDELAANINLKTNLFTDANFDNTAEYWSFFHITANASAGWYKGSFSTTTNNSTTGARQLNIYGTTNTSFYIEQPIILLPATTYTLSFLYRDEGNSTSPLRFAFYSANSSSTMKIIQNVETNDTLRWHNMDTGDKAYEFTFQCPSSTSSFSRCYVTFKTMSTLPSSQIYFWLFSYAGSASSVRNTHIAELQLEQNSTYTTWTPDVRYNYSMITQKADNIRLAVSDGLKETGINIDTNKITLTADNTTINGQLTVNSNDNGIKVMATTNYGGSSVTTAGYVTGGPIDSFNSWDNKACNSTNAISRLGANGYEYISPWSSSGRKIYLGEEGIRLDSLNTAIQLSEKHLYKYTKANNFVYSTGNAYKPIEYQGIRIFYVTSSGIWLNNSSGTRLATSARTYTLTENDEMIIIHGDASCILTMPSPGFEFTGKTITIRNNSKRAIRLDSQMGFYSTYFSSNGSSYDNDSHDDYNYCTHLYVRAFGCTQLVYNYTYSNVMTGWHEISNGFSNTNRSDAARTVSNMDNGGGW